MSPLPIEAIFLRLLGHFEACGIPYMIMGGMAIRALGIPRPTYDGDLTIDATEEQIATVLGRLEADGFTVPDEFRKGYRDWMAGMRKLALTYFEAGHAWRIDLFLVTTKYQRAAFGRRRLLSYLGSERPLMSPEDLIVHKLIAWRPKDRGDINDLLVLHRPLDQAYLRHWARELNVTDRLDEAMKAAEEA